MYVYVFSYTYENPSFLFFREKKKFKCMQRKAELFLLLHGWLTDMKNRGQWRGRGDILGKTKKLIEEEIRENERRYNSLNHVLNIRESFKERDINRSM